MKSLVYKVRHKQGLTLIEVIVGVAIIAILSLVMVGAFMTMTNVNQKANQLTNADEVLEEAIASNNSSAEVPTNVILDWGAGSGSGSSDSVTLPSTIITYTDPATGQTFKLVGKP